MAAAPVTNCFDAWLSEKLLSFNPDTDLDIFVSYITGILETETVEDEQINSLSELLSELLVNQSENDTRKVCEDIITKWSNINDDIASSGVDLNTRMHEIIVQQTNEAVKLKASQKTEKDAFKDAIVAQYSHISDGEETDEDSTETVAKALTSKQPPNKHSSSTAPTTAHNQDDLLTRNVNAVLVKEREKQARDQAKHDSELKKQKDKEDREKQKQKVTDRKENEKKRTQKGEKKR